MQTSVTAKRMPVPMHLVKETLSYPETAQGLGSERAKAQ
jgi:hypothetical protein